MMMMMMMMMQVPQMQFLCKLQNIRRKDVWDK